MEKKNKEYKWLPAEQNPLIQSDYDINRYSLLIKIMQEHSRLYTKIIQAQSNKRILQYGFKSVEDKVDLLNWIYIKTPKLKDFNYNLVTRCYWITHGISDFPKCQLNGCENKIGVKQNIRAEAGYNHHCCRSHAAQDIAVQEKTLATHIKKHGKWFNNREQAAQTCENRYGVGITNPSQLQDVKDKKAQTCMINYGVKVPAQSEIVRDRMKATNQSTYGYDYATQVPEIRQKMAETNIKNLGVDNPFKLRSTAEKGLEGRRKKYGTVRGNMKRYVYSDGTAFDSSWELYVWIYCLDNGLNIKREPCRFQYFKDGKPYWYYPDFEINGIFVEVKGDNFFNTAGEPYYNGKYSWKEKYQCVLDNNVQLWRSKEMKPIIKSVKEKYGKQYITQFKIVKPESNACSQKNKSNGII